MMVKGPERGAPRKIGGDETNHTGRPKDTEKMPVFTEHDIKRSSIPEETVVFDDNNVKKVKEAHGGIGDTQPVPIAKKRWRISSLFKPREKKPNFVLSIVLTTIQMSFVAIFVAVAVVIGSVVGVANAYLETTPELDTDKIETQQLSSYIRDKEGNLLATYTGQENRDWAGIDEIPEDLQNAVIAVEDIRFYDHNGVDFRRLMGAFVSNVATATSEGGSTITQQLIKNKLLSNERSYKRKLQEAYLAMELEKKYDKEQILEAYLNTIPLGGRVYGVKTAAKDYFGKSLNQLNLQEMVCIAAITQRPHQYNPRRATYGEGDLVGLVNRMNIIAERMWWSDMITEEQYKEVYIPRNEYTTADGELKPGFLSKWRSMMNILETSPTSELYPYPHFVEYVIYQVQTFMLRQQGLEDTTENRKLVEQEMRSKGYTIYATVDGTIQDTVQSTLSEWDKYPAFPDPDLTFTYEEDGSGNVIETMQPQASAVVVDNDSGHLLAIVGSRDAPTSASTFNRAYQSEIQVGSSIKPIAVYGPAFDLGLSPGYPVANIPVPINGWYNDEGELSAPRQTGTEGPVTLRHAIVNSLNVAAARTLADYTTVSSSMYYLEKLGVDTDRIEQTETDTLSGLSMGAAPITPLEMAGAYATIARGGEYLEPISFTQVVDSEGNVVIDAEKERIKHQAFKPSTAYMLTDTLTQAINEGTGTRAKIPDMTTAGKTGTVADNLGTFFAGYTPHYTSALWMGHDHNKSFGNGTFASNSTAPLWQSYMEKIHVGLPDQAILPYDPAYYGLVEDVVCKWSGMKPGSNCDTTPSDWWLDGTQPLATCDVCSYGSQVLCRDSGKLWVEGACPPDAQVSSGYRSFPESSPYRQWGGGGSGVVSVPCDLHMYMEMIPIQPDPVVPDPAADPNAAPAT
ncbi:MAG: transglycosylase domain-containing protein [Christensenellaceae bacterium]|jgi:penicillin-binding protein 1A